MKIYMTRYNTDMTEGRGPMRNDKAFLHWQDAADYIDYKPGIMGWIAKWSAEKHGEWDIQEMEVLEGPFDEQAETELVLEKLTDAEFEALRLSILANEI